MTSGESAVDLSEQECAVFARDLRSWYGAHARLLPWRGIRDPYRTWVSEIMLQQTRVSTVVDHYQRFLQRFPTLVSLALAPVDDVLALWSGLGYYRRARLLHRTAQLLLQEHAGTLPDTAAELRRLPGVGNYTSAAIASIAFGERVAVLDGNVERVLLRVTGRPENTGAETVAFLNTVAQSLVPERDPGDHNQAMMELGATVCLPRNPRCGECPVFSLCRTRGEHVTEPRAPMRSKLVRYALTTRRSRAATGLEVLLQRRPADASLMAGMLELPELAEDSDGKTSFTLLGEPVLRVRHAIVGTNYYVEVLGVPTRREVVRRMMRQDELDWWPIRELERLPLTGLARKVLQRMHLMRAPGDSRALDVPLLIGLGGTARTGDEA